MTFADLMAQPDDGYVYELVRGEILRMPPPKGDHGDVEAALVEAIGRYLVDRARGFGWQPEHGRAARSRLVGYLASGEAGIRFSLPEDPDQTRGVDVLYLSVEQFKRLEEYIREEYIPEVPALVAEVISPSETATYSNEKVTDYLAGGAKMVWQLFPRTRTVRVYAADSTTWVIPSNGTLDGGDVLSGFQVLVAELFA
jgi:Uma2 family endonuclease